MQKRMIARVLVCVCALTFVVCSVAGAAGKKFEKEVEKEKAAVKLVREVQRGGYDIISTDELKKNLAEKKDVIIVDSMPFEASYKREHVPGAVQFLFPVTDMTKWNTKETDGKSKEEYEALLGTDKDKTVIVYCAFVKCTRSHNGAAWAKKLGYKNVYRYPGGIYAWKGAGNATESVK